MPLSPMIATKRLQKELAKLQKGTPPGIILHQAEDLQDWLVDIQVLDDNPLYAGDTYRLHFSFGPRYPIEPPEVWFVTAPPTVTKIPIHPHVYSNGIICLDLLDRQGWTPVNHVESVCVSLQSVLSSNDKNERPEGDDEFCRSNIKRPRDINFVFEDDRV